MGVSGVVMFEMEQKWFDYVTFGRFSLYVTKEIRSLLKSP